MGQAEHQEELRRQIRGLVAAYFDAAEAPGFVPGQTPVLTGWQVSGLPEALALVDVALAQRFAVGPAGAEFERRFGAMFARKALLVNSGSSANLLAVSALRSPLLGDRRLMPGDEVVAAACGFPTTLGPILQAGLVPVLVDVSLPTYNPPAEAVREAIGPRTRAIFIAHMLGNPFDLAAIGALARERGLRLIEDCADALGSTYGGVPVGTFGDLATFSFYPAHQISTGEGGAVLCADEMLARAVLSLRDWGRDCRCPPGCDDTCGRRFAGVYGTLPEGYDHKYVYSHVGYNLKATEMQAALGLAQLDRLPGFCEARRRNYAALRSGLEGVRGLLLPEAKPNADPAWFGFPLTVAEGWPVSRDEVVRRLNARRIATRPMFGGNLLRQPAFCGIPARVPQPLETTDRVLRSSFWIGLHPGMGKEQCDYVIDAIRGA